MAYLSQRVRGMGRLGAADSDIVMTLPGGRYGITPPASDVGKICPAWGCGDPPSQKILSVSETFAAPPSAVPVPPDTSGGLVTFLTQPVSWLGGLPVWGALAGGLVAWTFLGGKR